MQEVYYASQKAWFTTFIAIIKKVEQTLLEEIMLNEFWIGGSPPIKGILVPLMLLSISSMLMLRWKYHQTAYTGDTFDTAYTIETALHCQNISM